MKKTSLKICVCEKVCVTSQSKRDSKHVTYRSYHRNKKYILRFLLYLMFTLWVILLVQCHMGRSHVITRIQSVFARMGQSGNPPNKEQPTIEQEDISLRHSDAVSDVTIKMPTKNNDVSIRTTTRHNDVRIKPPRRHNDVTILPANYKQPPPPNPRFIFHNKLPKSGSSTMNNIIKILAKKNKFNYLKAESGVVPLNDELPLVKYLERKMTSPYFLLKHHYWFNFTKYGKEQPTFINVIRDPVEWFVSRFYFSRFGWKRKPGCRDAACSMDKHEFNMDVDDCVRTKHPHCVTSPWLYLPYFCGPTKECIEMANVTDKERSLETAKRHLVEDYHVVGILEQFEDTLNMLEMMLPSYFKGAVQVWKSKDVQYIQEVTKTLSRKSVSPETRDYLEQGPLKQEVTLYKFARKLFNEKLLKLGIEPVTSE
ncbi:heparan sulfate 2-O-sulfotransferase 1-like [Ciona intestinalis]